MSFGYQVLGFGSGGVAATYVTATGGTEATCGDYKIHTFTGPGTLCVSCAGSEAGSDKIDFLVIAGGGGGAVGECGGGAGGAGGYRESKQPGAPWTASPIVATPGSGTNGITAAVQPYPITIGGGGAGGTTNPYQTNGDGDPGAVSTFSTITSAGGGGSGGGNRPVCDPVGVGKDGGSGGGGAGPGGAPVSGANNGDGNTPPATPSQGFPGGLSKPEAGGSGGGAGAAGNAATGSPPSPNHKGGVGGDGVGTEINPSPTYGTPGPSGPLRYFAGGGGASGAPSTTGAAGGTGGGGAGNNTPCQNGGAGTINAGGGGGGQNAAGHACGPENGGLGGSGVTVIRYKFQ